MSTSGDTRYCPVCGSETPDVHCANDGVATVLKRRFGRDALSYGPGDLLADRYRITGIIGKGAYGAVYAAQHTGTGQPCALKLLALSPQSTGDDVTRRFFQEARVTASLRHQNTIRVFDVGQAEDGPLFIAMELLNGPSMAQYLIYLLKTGEVMAEASVIDVLTQLLGSLAEAHREGLVHRDIKPGNIILSTGPEGETVVKLLDFGIARTVDSSLTATGNSLGTPAYMSPEQCQSKSLDGRSDLYSVAILAYLCVTGRLPFESRDPLALMLMQCSEPALDPREVTEVALTDGFVKVLMRALAKAPKERFDDARAMRTALEQVRLDNWLQEPLFALDTGTAFDVVEMSGSDSDVRRAATDEERPALASEAPTSALHSVSRGDTDQVLDGLGVPTTALPAVGQSAVPAEAAAVAPEVALPDAPSQASPEPFDEALGDPSALVPNEAREISPMLSDGTVLDPVPPLAKPMRWVVLGAVVVALLVGLFFGLSGGEEEAAKAVTQPTLPEAEAPPSSAKQVVGRAASAAPNPGNVAHAAPAAGAVNPAGAAASEAPSTAELEARIAAGLAEKADTLEKKIDYMREASKLVPDNPVYSGKLVEFKAEMNVRKRMKVAAAAEAAQAASRRKAKAAKAKAAKAKPAAAKKEVPGEVQPMFAE